MWVLYTIKKTNQVQGVMDVVVSRLRPTQTYLIMRRGKYDTDFTASIKMGTFPASEVTNITKRPDVKLTQEKTKRVEALVNDRTVNNVHYLHDADIIRVSGHDVRYRVCWENITIYMDFDDNREYQSLVQMGTKLGFHVVKEWTKFITHIYVPDTPTSELSANLTKGLMQNKYIINKHWIYNVFFKLDDRKATSQAANETIEPIVWEDFGPLKRPGQLSQNASRKTLFERMEFVVFNRSQLKDLSKLVELGKGTVKYHDLDSDEEVDINHNTMLVALPERDQYDRRKFEQLVDRYTAKTKTVRVIFQVEIAYAIVYASTNFMCNPVASLDNLNFSSLDEEKKAHESCSMSTVPYQFNEDEEEDQENSRVIHDEDQKIDRPNQCNFSTRNQMNTSSPAVDKTSPTPEQREPAPTRDIAPVRQASPAPEEEVVPVHESSPAREITPLSENSPIQAMSPLSVNSPLRESGVDPLGAISPVQPSSPIADQGSSSYGQRMDGENASNSIPHMIDDLYDCFTDLVNGMKIKPPPKKAPSPSKPTSLESSSSSTRQPRENDINAPPQASSHQSPTPNETNLQRTPTQDTSNTHHSSTSATTASSSSRATDLTSRLSSSSSLPGTKRVSSTINTPRVEKRKKIVTREEEEEEEEEMKEEPTTPPQQQQQQQEIIEEPRVDRTASPSNRSSSPMETLREEQSGQYNKVVYAPLIVQRQPPTRTQQTSSRSSRGGVNYKRFRKVRQFKNENEMDIVYLVSSSQRTREQFEERRARETVGVRIQDTEQFDPDLFIRSARRR